jgi:hypothetical protein
MAMRERLALNLAFRPYMDILFHDVLDVFHLTSPGDSGGLTDPR